MLFQETNRLQRYLKYAAAILGMFVIAFVPKWTASASIHYLTMTVGETKTLYPNRDDSLYATRAVTGGTWISQGHEFVEVTTSPYQTSYCTVLAKKEFSSYIVVQMKYSYAPRYGQLMQDTVDYLIQVQPHKHTWGQWVTQSEPSCKSAGRKKRVCQSCKQAQYASIPAAHTLKKIARKEPTAKTSGNIQYWKCKKCGTCFRDAYGNNSIAEKSTVLAPTSSSKAKNSNSAAVKKSQQFEVGVGIYKVTSVKANNRTVTYMAPGKSKKNLTSITVPSTVKIKGKTYKVTAVANKAFTACTKLQKVTVGKNISSIGAETFYNCKTLKKLIIKSSKLKKIGKNAVQNIYWKAVIDVPAKKVKAYKKLLQKAGGYKKTMKVK